MYEDEVVDANVSAEEPVYQDETLTCKACGDCTYRLFWIAFPEKFSHWKCGTT